MNGNEITDTAKQIQQSVQQKLDEIAEKASNQGYLQKATSSISSFFTLNKFTILLTVFLFLLAFCIGFFIYNHVSDNGGGIEQIRNELNTVKEQQRQTQQTLGNVQSGLSNSIQRLDRAEKSISRAQESVNRIGETSSRIEDRINTAKESIGNSAGILGDSESTIGDSLAIIREVRKRKS